MAERIPRQFFLLLAVAVAAVQFVGITWAQACGAPHPLIGLGILSLFGGVGVAFLQPGRLPRSLDLVLFLGFAAAAAGVDFYLLGRWPLTWGPV